jgi:hypothetical protein
MSAECSFVYTYAQKNLIDVTVGTVIRLAEKASLYRVNNYEQ